MSEDKMKDLVDMIASLEAGMKGATNEVPHYLKQRVEIVLHFAAAMKRPDTANVVNVVAESYKWICHVCDYHNVETIAIDNSIDVRCSRCASEFEGKYIHNFQKPRQ